MKKLVLFLLVVVAAFGSVTSAFAQSSRGSVEGNIVDQAGAAIPNADVTLSSPATGTAVTTKSNGRGIYRFDAVAPGEYSVTVAASGFSKEVQPATVVLGSVAGRDFTLKIGTSNETVEVVGAPVELQTEDAVRGGTILPEALADLPIAGQNPLNLMLTLPGVAKSNTGSNQDTGIGSINGARGRSNNFLIDGLQNNDISVAGPQFTITNDDELQAVTFLTGNFTAEYGRAGGGVINEITKSGANKVHGTVAQVYRSEVLNASTNTQRLAYFPALAAYVAGGSVGAAPVLKGKFKENIPAFTVGGPVIIPHFYDGHDKTFFFGAGQWDRFSSGGSTSAFVVPTANGVATLQSLASSCPNVASYLSTLGSARGVSNISQLDISLPTTLASTSCGGGARTGQQVEIGTFTRAAPEVALDNNHIIRFDHIASQRQSFLVRWLYDNTIDTIGGQIGINSLFDVPFTGKTMSPAFNHTFAFTPNVLNEFRFGFVRNIYTFNNAAGISNTLPAFTVSGLTSIQLSATFPQGRTANSFQYSDTVTWNKGKHSMRFGVEFLRQLATQQAPYNSRGAYTYTSTASNAFGVTTPISALADFIDNVGGNTPSASISIGSGRYHPNLFTTSLFAQDTYKASRDLTVTYGLRYENFGQPGNIFKSPAFIGFGDNDFASTARVGQDNNNFGPSIGFAYNPHLAKGIFDGRFVLRGGYQVSYDTFYNNLLSNMAAGVPNTASNATVVSTVSATTPRGYQNLTAFPFTAAPFNPFTSLGSQFKQNIRNPYTGRMSLGIEQELPGRIVMDVAYVGSLGRQLFFTNDANPRLYDPTTGTYAQENTALYGAQFKRFYANRGAINYRDSGLTSNYHSLQVQVRKRGIDTMLGKLSFSEAYTYSKNLDVLNDVFATFASGSITSRSQTIAGPIGLIDYGPADTDLRHISATVIQMQFKGTRNRLLNAVVGGWSTNPILIVQSGSPYTVSNGVDRDFDGQTAGDRPDIGNPHAPVNTRAVVTPTSNCTTGYYDPGLRIGSAAISTACVSPSNVRFVQVTTYSPTSPTMESRNAITTTRFLDLDVDLLKKFNVGERLKFELGGEFFNVTNNQNFNTPSAPVNVSTLNGTSFQNFVNTSTNTNGGGRTMRVRAKIIF
jgi:hypothetical protein